MKTSSYISLLSAAVILGSLCGCRDIENSVILVQTDPLKKILKEQTYFEDSPDTLALAKGETASFQLVFRCPYAVKDLQIHAEPLKPENPSAQESGSQEIEAGLKAFVGYVHVPDKFLSGIPSNVRIKTISGYYPDPLWEIDMIDVQPMSNQPVWVNFNIPKDVSAGNFSSEITLTGKIGGKKFSVSKSVHAKVYDVVLPESPLFIDNWINPYPQELKRMNDGKMFPLYSDLYWDLNKTIANKMRDYGQNVYRTFPLQEGNWKISGQDEDGNLEYSFNFRYFDKSVEMYMEEGGMKRITGAHIGQRLEPGWYSHTGVVVPMLSGKDTVIAIKPLETPEAKNFLDQFIPALYSHLKEKGWDDIYCQYLADEPADGEYTESYLRILQYVKGLAPDLKIIDALHRTPEIARNIDVPVCILDRLHLQYNELYKPMVESGKEVWFYTCMEPLGNYANRFIEQPLIQTRILHWINFRYDIDGYLCWGLNSWRNDRIYGEHLDWGNVPAGDCWIIYPGYRKVFGSIRLEAMRDGICDYGLLRMLKEKNPAEAERLAAETIMNFDSYDNDIDNFRQRRIRILELLSENKDTE